MDLGKLADLSKLYQVLQTLRKRQPKNGPERDAELVNWVRFTARAGAEIVVVETEIEGESVLALIAKAPGSLRHRKHLTTENP